MKKAMIDYTKKPKGDEFFTPPHGIYPILKYLKPNSTIWCLFDKKDSHFVKVLGDAGHSIVYTHIDYEEEQNFFNYKKDDYAYYSGCNRTSVRISEIDYIISNPPYSTKNQVLEKLYELGIPFAMLMPLTTLENEFRSNLFRKHGLQLLVLDKRINFVDNNSFNWFNTSYFCWNILPQQLIFERLEK